MFIAKIGSKWEMGNCDKGPSMNYVDSKSAIFVSVFVLIIWLHLTANIFESGPMPTP